MADSSNAGLDVRTQGTLFSLLGILSTDFAAILVLQAGVAIGEPFVMNGISKLAANWFPRKERVLATGLGSMALFLGTMISLSVTLLLMLSNGFQSMLLCYTVIAVAGALFFMIAARRKPVMPPEPEEEGIETFSTSAFRRVIRSRDLALLSAAFFIGVGLFTAPATWLEKVLELFGISITDAGIVGGVFIVGGILGSIVIPVLSDRTARRKPFLVADLLLSAAALMVFVTGGGLVFHAISAFILGFFLMSALPVGLQVSAELVGASMAGTAASVLWLFSQVGSVLFIVLMEFEGRSRKLPVLDPSPRCARSCSRTPVFADYGDRQRRSRRSLWNSSPLSRGMAVEERFLMAPS